VCNEFRKNVSNVLFRCHFLPANDLLRTYSKPTAILELVRGSGSARDLPPPPFLEQRYLKICWMEEEVSEKAEEEQGFAYGSTRYWDAKYAKEKGQLFDWYLRYGGVEDIVRAEIDKKRSVLELGCGVSRFAADMVEDGYEDVSCVDASKVAVETMRSKFGANVRVSVGNGCALCFPNDSFDAVIAKATLDMMLCGDEGPKKVLRACQECSRVLRPGGLFLVVSSDENIAEYLDPATVDLAWCLTDRIQIPAPSLEPQRTKRSLYYGGAPDDCYFVFLCRKRETRSRSSRVLTKPHNKEQPGR